MPLYVPKFEKITYTNLIMPKIIYKNMLPNCEDKMGEFVYCDFTKISCNGSVRTGFQYIFKKEVMKRLEEKIDALTTKLQASYCNDVLVQLVTTYMHDDFVETSAILLKAIHLSRSCG